MLLVPLEGCVAASLWALSWGVCRYFAGSRNSWAKNKPALAFWGKASPVAHVLSWQSQGRATRSLLTEDEGCSGCPGPCLSLRRLGCDPKPCSKRRHKTEHYEMRCPWRLPPTCSTGNFLPSTALADKHLRPLDPARAIFCALCCSLDVQQIKWLHTPRARFKDTSRSLHLCFPEDLLYTGTCNGGNKRLLLSEY